MAITDDIAERWSIFSEAKDIVDRKFNIMMGSQTSSDTGLIYDQLNAVTQRIQEFKQLMADAAEELDAIDTDVTMEDLEDINIDDFTGIPPEDIVVDFNPPANIELIDDLETAIHDKLMDDITETQPAIPSDVEDSIILKDTERALLIHEDTLDRIRDEKR